MGGRREGFIAVTTVRKSNRQGDKGLGVRVRVCVCVERSMHAFLLVFSFDTHVYVYISTVKTQHSLTTYLQCLTPSTTTVEHYQTTRYD